MLIFACFLCISAYVNSLYIYMRVKPSSFSGHARRCDPIENCQVPGFCDGDPIRATCVVCVHPGPEEVSVLCR